MCFNERATEVSCHTRKFRHWHQTRVYPSCSRRGTPSPDHLHSRKTLSKKTKFYTWLHKVRSEGKPRKTYGAMETIIRTDLLSCADRSYSRSRGLPRRLGASDGSNLRRRERRQRSRLAQRRDQGHSNRHRRGADRSVGRGRALRASQSSARAVHGRSSAVGLPHLCADWNRASG